MEKRHNYVRKVAETAVQVFIPGGDKANVAGLVLAGSAEFKNELSESDMFDGRLKALVLAVVDVSYGAFVCFSFLPLPSFFPFFFFFFLPCCCACACAAVHARSETGAFTNFVPSFHGIQIKWRFDPRANPPPPGALLSHILKKTWGGRSVRRAGGWPALVGPARASARCAPSLNLKPA
jgi:hypothetical protein